eukprot:Skav225987  [mRNA]  locus=scaffold4003:53946:61425:+ [translate_table: standard]
MKSLAAAVHPCGCSSGSAVLVTFAQLAPGETWQVAVVKRPGEGASRTEQTPLLDAEAVEEDFDAGKSIAQVGVLLTVPRLIGFGIGFAIYKFGATSKYDAKLKGFTAEDGYCWLYMAVYIFSVMVSFINLLLGCYGTRHVALTAGNLRANMFIYRLDDGSKKQGATVAQLADQCQEGGGIGEYNRANRSLGHFVENIAGRFLALIPFAGYIFAFPTFILIVGELGFGFPSGGGKMVASCKNCYC